MGWLFGDKDAVEEHRTALKDINDYANHQHEQNPRTFEAGYDTDEYARLESRVAAAEQHVPWWRR